MLIREYISLFERDLSKLSQEIESYSREENLWLVTGEITNSAGNLCLHLVGNLSHFIGKGIGGFDYRRDRDFEFAGKGVQRKELLERIEQAKRMLVASLEGLDESMLSQDYPVEVFGYKMTHNYFLIHLFGHFSYHLGQINYHRRILDK